MAKGKTKYIFVTGGVLSGLGKGITAASIGALLKARGLKINAQKLDPYLNVDAGTLNPAEHGECFVTKDGAETDLDLGHYERFLDVDMTQKSSMMSGRILLKLINDERAGKYLGKTVQVVPHLTEAIQDAVIDASDGFDVQIVEIGGTVGDAESPAFFEAIRSMPERVGRENCLYVQVVYLPYLGASKETKTKPAQNAVRELRALGIAPDVLVARSEQAPSGNVREKLHAFCGVEREGIAILPNAHTVYEVPLTLEDSGIGEFITDKLNIKSIKSRRPKLNAWRDISQRAKTDYETTLKVGMVAKYLDNEDTYYSVIEALHAAAWKHEVNLDLIWVNAETLQRGSTGKLRRLDGIVVPGGFGKRAIEGKIKAAQYAIKNNVPYLGLCLGMQVGAIAIARKSGLKSANSVEVDPATPHPIIHIMADQREVRETGGTMRLGNYKCMLQKGSLAARIYGRKSVMERHRHRYEFNNDYRERLEKAGMVASGLSPDGRLVEMIELKDHPYFIGSQFHPEFKSRPSKPHPMFDGFISALKKG